MITPLEYFKKVEEKINGNNNDIALRQIRVSPFSSEDISEEDQGWNFADLSIKKWLWVVLAEVTQSH